MVEIGTEDFDRDHSIESRLPTSVDDAEAAAAGNSRVFETFGRQLGNDVGIDLTLGALH
ncbi:hypothetical protein [Rhodococcus jostii]|uniref:hypothetical protein n=1 Tax=Rhodococcus jostii TaxID=132919 RepID=UPI00364148BA